MSYGSLFLPEERRLKPDIGKVYYDLVDKEIRDGIEPPEPYLHQMTQKLSRLYETAVDDPRIQERVRAMTIKPKKNSPRRKGSCLDSISETSSTLQRSRTDLSMPSHVSQKHFVPKKRQELLSVTATIQKEYAREGGKYHPPHIVDSYEPRFEGKPSSSTYNVNTPKMWPKETEVVSNLSSSLYPYDASIRDFTQMNSFGSHSHGKTLTKSIYESTGMKPMSPYITDRPCSKSAVGKNGDSLSSSSLGNFQSSTLSSCNMSALQQTLHECGRLRLADQFKDDKDNEQIDKASKFHRTKLHDHVRWLKKPFSSKDKWHHPSHAPPADDDTSAISMDSTLMNKAHKQRASDRSVSSSSTISRSIGDSWIPLTNTNNSTARRSKLSSSDTASVSCSVLADTASNTKNPFRSRRVQATEKIRFCRSLPRLTNDKDPLDYRDPMMVKTVNNFNACIQPDLGINKVPSKKEVSDILQQLTRKQILCYQARVIESGALIKALKDTKHETPGFQAILMLHKSFVDASAVNMNPYLLSKGQIFQTIQKHVPWHQNPSISRLLTSYDTTNTGLIRYPRISCTLLASFETAMINIAGALDRNKDKWTKYFISNDEASLCGQTSSSHSVTSKSITLSLHTKKTKDSFKNGEVTLSTLTADEMLTEDEFRTYRGELFTLRFLHQFYAECAGYVQESVDPKKLNKDATLLKSLAENEVVALMKLEDLRELFSCCVLGTDDEQAIDKVLQPMMQYLLQKLSRPTIDDKAMPPNKLVNTDYTLASTLDASKVLTYSGVKALFSQLKVNFDDLIDAVLLHPALLREFIRQVRAFRKAAQPYILNGSKPIEEAVSLHSSKM